MTLDFMEKKKKSLYHLEKFMMDGAIDVHLFNFLYVVYMINNFFLYI